LEHIFGSTQPTPPWDRYEDAHRLRRLLLMLGIPTRRSPARE